MNVKAKQVPPADGFSEAYLDAQWDRRYDLLFKSWVQVRYHRKRQRFFDLADKGTKAVTLLLGASLFGKVFLDVQWVATGISALGLMALVFGYGDRKQTHKELAEQAASLVASIEAVPAGQLNEELNAKWAAEFARICAKAPPALKTLTIICEHEQSVVDGKSDAIKLPLFIWRWISQIKA